MGRWDTFVRSQLESGHWYTVIDPVTQRLTADEPGQFRAKSLSRGLVRFFAAAGLPAMSPHRFFRRLRLELAFVECRDRPASVPGNCLSSVVNPAVAQGVHQHLLLFGWKLRS